MIRYSVCCDFCAKEAPIVAVESLDRMLPYQPDPQLLPEDWILLPHPPDPQLLPEDWILLHMSTERMVLPKSSDGLHDASADLAGTGAGIIDAILDQQAVPFACYAVICPSCFQSMALLSQHVENRFKMAVERGRENDKDLLRQQERARGLGPGLSLVVTDKESPYRFDPVSTYEENDK